jgi:KaiC/GvpD/RAD55 family RecA-like ATPase
MTERIKTGVDGLDAILGGGITAGSTVLVSGNPGTGKSVLGLQYLYAGATEFDERGIYLSFEEGADDLRASAESIGFDRWSEVVDSGRVTVFDKRMLLDDREFSETLDRLVEELSGGDYRRLVMDSLTMFELFFEGERENRRYLLKFTDVLKEFGVTSLLVAEQSAIFPDQDIGLENFLTDGNVFMIQTPTGSGVTRYIWVGKMRKQAVDTDIFPMEIGRGGITVHDNAAGFSMVEGLDSF